MIFPLIFLTLIHATCAKSVGTEFEIQGNGTYNAGNLKVDIHLESIVNTTTTETTVPPTTYGTTVPPTTSAATAVTPNTSVTTPPPTTSAPSAPPTPGPTTGTSPKPTTLTVNTTVNTTVTTTATAASTTALPTAIGTNITGTTEPPTTGAAVTGTTPTPAPEFIRDENYAANSKLFSDLDRTALELHNYYRSIHEAPLLILDASLRRDAQEYAIKVAKSQMLRPEQDFVLNFKNEGENLGFRCSATRPDPGKALRQILKRWYDEGCQYNFQTPPSDRYTYRHFTQMTWNGSRRLGVGIAYGQINNLHCLYFVARYRPRGNLGNKLQYVNNVRKGVFDASFCRPIGNQLSNQEVVLKE